MPPPGVTALSSSARTHAHLHNHTQVIKSGVPASIKVENEAALLRLEPNATVSLNLSVVDQWGNHVRASSRRSMQVSPVMDRSLDFSLCFGGQNCARV